MEKLHTKDTQTAVDRRKNVISRLWAALPDQAVGRLDGAVGGVHGDEARALFQVGGTAVLGRRDGVGEARRDLQPQEDLAVLTDVGGPRRTARPRHVCAV